MCFLRHVGAFWGCHLMARTRGIQPPPAPAEPGNERSLTHGIYSKTAERLMQLKGDALVVELYELHPHLRNEDVVAVKMYAVTLVKVLSLEAWLQKNGVLDSRSLPRPALEHLRKWLERLEKAGARLGVDPVSRAALAVDELEAHGKHAELARRELAEGRRLREAADADVIDGQAVEVTVDTPAGGDA